MEAIVLFDLGSAIGIFDDSDRRTVRCVQYPFSWPERADPATEPELCRLLGGRSERGEVLLDVGVDIGAKSVHAQPILVRVHSVMESKFRPAAGISDRHQSDGSTTVMKSPQPRAKNRELPGSFGPR